MSTIKPYTHQTSTPSKPIKPTLPPYALSLRERTQEKVKKIAFDLLAYMTKEISPSRSRIYNARSVHADRNAFERDRENYFKCKVIGKSRNIAQEDFIRNRDDYKASKQLINEISKFEEASRFKVHESKFNQTSASNGICAGIGIDIAERLLVKGEDIETILLSGEKGATVAAAANQAVYSLIVDESSALAVPALFSVLAHNFIGEHEEHPLNLSYEELLQVRPALFKLDSLTMNILSHSKHSSTNSSFDDVFEAVLDEAKNQLQHSGKHPWLSKNDKGFIIRDMKKFKESVIQNSATEVNERTLDALLSFYPLIVPSTSKIVRKQSILRNASENSLWHKLTVHAGKVFHPVSPYKKIKIKDSASDFDYLRKVVYHHFDLERISLVAKARHIALEPVALHSTLFKNDEEYLKQLKGIDSGLYGLTLITERSGHFITLLKQEDGSFYIMDPNHPQVYAKNFEEANYFLTNILAGYTYREQKRPWQTEDPQYHELNLLRMKAI